MFEQLPESELISLISSAIVAVIALVFSVLVPAIRFVVFYKRHQHILTHDGSTKNFRWDVQWENHGVTIHVGEVHNNSLENVRFVLRADGREHKERQFPVGQGYIIPKNWPIHLKLASIVRFKSANSKSYIVTIVTRVKRR